MEVGDICSRDVDTIDGGESAQAAAKRMLQRNVGTLVIVSDTRRPIGIVTDRDLATRVIAQGLSNDTVIRDVMTGNPRIIRESHLIDAALVVMRTIPCRRLPVVDERDALVGILSLDDVHEYHVEAGVMMGAILRSESPERVGES